MLAEITALLEISYLNVMDEILSIQPYVTIKSLSIKLNRKNLPCCGFKILAVVKTFWKVKSENLFKS